jgi:NADPH-dependent 2,4-dienoyl-CoA reductase/sulfur reductase-like enzyme
MATIINLLKGYSASTRQVVIIGNGISGITCARNIRKKSNYCITVISSETEYHFSRTALMYIYMGHLRYEDTKPYEDWFWTKNRINLLNKHVSKVESSSKTLYFLNGEFFKYDILIIASGSNPNKFGWPGQDLKGVQGLYSYQDLQLLEENTKEIKQAVIVGGGLIGVELAEMLRSRNINVTFLIREKHFWDIVMPTQEAILIERHMREHHVNLKQETELGEIISDDNGKVKAIITKSGEKIECQFVGLTVGVSPNISFLKDSEIKTDRGILVNEFFETNVKDVYAIGDCAQFISSINGRRPIEQVWYTGRMHGETLAHSLTVIKTSYNPGHWFNSAKFFDIEYQTYGNVPGTISAPLSSLYWEHSSGKMCFRIVYDIQTHHLIGINVFGIRMRHEIFDRWLSENKKIGYVLEHLPEANFDPEFFVKYENEINFQFKKELV